MRSIQRWFVRIQNFASRHRGDERLREELNEHLAMQTEDNIRSGMSAAEARRHARLELGGFESIREDYHAEEGLPFLENLVHDARFTLRLLSKSSGFTMVAVLTLALGIGACTAIFSAVNPILFEPLPYPHANRILTIWSTFKGERSRLAFGNWRELVERNHSFEALAVYEPWHPVLVDPGFNSSDLLTIQIKTSGHEFDDTSSAPTAGSDARRRFFEQALDAVRRVPGVMASGLTTNLPLTDDAVIYGIYGARFESDPPNVGTDVFRYVVSPGYCEAMQIPLRRGRFLSEPDGSDAPPVVLISESLAKSEFPEQDPIGKRVHVGPTDRPWYTVVGVVGDVKQNSLVTDEPNAVYLTEAQSWFADDTMSVVVRERGDAAALTPAVENAIWSVDKNQALVRVATADQLMAAGKATRRFVLMLFEAFALVALALAATGIYGVLSGSVAERTREIGVRSALGASREDILGLVLGKGMKLAAIGAAIGLCAAVVSSSALVSLLFGVSRLDPLTYLSVTALLLAVAAAACAVPAARAVAVDPVEALRSE